MMKVLIQMDKKKRRRAPRGTDKPRARFRTGRWLLGSVLILDLVVALIVFPGSLGLAPALAQTKKKQADPPPKSLTLDAVQLLGKELDARTEELLLREAQMADAAVAGVTGTTEQTAGASAAATKPADEAGGEKPIYSAESLRELGAQLVSRAEELNRREAELAEALRSDEVLRRSGVVAEEGPEAQDDAQAEAEPEPDPEVIKARDAFVRLQKAYEKMEPESAAIALSQLASRDRDAVVALLEGWNARTSGAILDALTQSDPALAADLSYEIYRRGKLAE